MGSGLAQFIWQIILRVFILQIRPRKSAAIYKSIWTKDGSPLLNISNKQVNAIRHRLKNSHKNTIIKLGMRYGNPSITKALTELLFNRVI